MQNVLTDSGLLGNRSRGAVTPFERTISVISNRMYLKALLDTKRFDEYFGVALTLIEVYLLLTQSYMPFSFAYSILAQAENTAFDLTTKEINNLLSLANTQLAETYLKQAPSTKDQQTTISSIKLLKDVLVLIIRICGHFMESLETLKATKECTNSFSKMILNLTNIFTYFLFYLARQLR